MERSIMSHNPSNDEQTRQVREWVAAYRLWNEQEQARRRVRAGQASVEEKLDWQLAEHAEDYVWSSARFYVLNEPALMPLSDARELF